MTIINQDFSLYNADTTFITVSAVDKQGNPLDMTGTQELQWFFLRSDAVVLMKTLGAGIEFIDQAGGVFKITLDDVDTAALPEGSVFPHKVRHKDVNGKWGTLLIGRMTINET